MPFAPSVINDENLVPAARFGAALHRVRSSAGATLAAIARASDRRFLPDDLVAVERGESPIDDGDVRLLSELYGLAPRPWAPASALELVLDRAPMSDFDPVAPLSTPSPPGSHGDLLVWTACRFVALSVLLGIDVTSGPLGLDVLAEAIERPRDATVELVDGVLRSEAPTIGAMIQAMHDRVVVPEVGFLVAETATGTLLLVGRGTVPASAPVVAASGTLFELLDAAR